MFNILIAEDDYELRHLFQRGLIQNGYRVRGVEDGKAALEALEKEYADLIISDIMMPVMDGYELVRALREAGNQTPVLMITAKDAFDDMRKGFLSGTDDYMVKPFLPQELLLRVYAVLRRTYKEDSPLVVLDGCTIDFSRAEVNKGGEVIPLTAKEHTLLETLARNEGKIVTVDALCEALWGDNPFGYENSLNAHVRRIREKIETDPSKPVSLITIKGLGYKLITRK